MYVLERSVPPGDITKDGVTDIDDLTEVILGWGECVNGELCAADVDNSTVVDVDDLSAVVLGWTN